MYLKLTISLALISWILLKTVSQGIQSPLLFIIGCALGISLYHASFGFAGVYRRLIEQKDMTGATAQLIMLGLAILLFAPILAQGTAFNHGVVGALAPVSVSMALGAFVFGIGMQIGGVCASGTLFTSGAGNPRMLLLLCFFCIGAFRGSLDLGWWNQLPGIGSVSLGESLGWEVAIPLQLLVLASIYVLMRWSGCHVDQAASRRNWVGWKRLLVGPWPLLYGAVALALLNWAVLVTAGHPWSITWGFTLWGAKLAVLTGWDPSTSAFWTGGFHQAALSSSLLTARCWRRRHPISRRLKLRGARDLLWGSWPQDCLWGMAPDSHTDVISEPSSAALHPVACTAGCGSFVQCQAYT